MTGKRTIEYQIVGFPGCDGFYPKTANEARDTVRRKKQDQEKLAKSYEDIGDFRMAAEMRRRVRSTGYETRTVTEWEAGK